MILKQSFVRLLMAGLFVAASMTLARAEAKEYKIDSVHSTIGFSVAHLVVSKTNGEFDNYTGTIVYDPENLDGSSVDVEIQTASIDTNNEKRDGHLKSADFFNVTEYPAITFKGSKFEEDGDKIVITGDLTMKGVTKEVSIPFDIQGPVANPSGGSVIGLEGVATINRQEWDISWNKSLDNGGFVVGDEVMLKINVEAHSE